MIATAKRISTASRQGCCVILLVALSPAAPRAVAQGGGGYFIPGDPKEGMQAFLDKGCVRCHSVLGEGGRTAPDLARAPSGLLSAAETVAGMWNHAPDMWQRMRENNVEPPQFTDDEMANLFAFLYSVRSLDEPGDPENGRQLLSTKHCLDCHSVEETGARVAPALQNWTGYRNPVSWIEAMWNHGLPMQEMMAARGLSWPEFEGSEMLDVIAYIRTLGSNPNRHALLRLADPEAGSQLYRQKGCFSCHEARGLGQRSAPDLSGSDLPRTMGQFAAQMWNHAPAMWTVMAAQGLSRPQFSNKEMADLISYLFTQRYFEQGGDVQSGRRVFEDKGCVGCHSFDAAGPVDLSSWEGNVTPIRLAAALWNHGPVMFETMQQQQISWPRFQSGEIGDLMEFMDRGAGVARRAGANQ